MARNQLTHREDEVLHLAVAGLSNDEIAARLAISRRTVEAHMRTLFSKIGVTRRAQLITLYQGLSSDVTGSAEPEAVFPQRRDPAEYERRLQAYAAGIRGLVDRQFPLFVERVEITVLVGEQDGRDVVIERRWTRPRPYLVYRILGPIVPRSDGPFELDDLALVCHVNGPDTHVDVHPVRDVDGRLLLLILFQPGLQAETEWLVRYRSPELWNPLRSSGRDTLSWATGTFDERHPPTTDELTLKVVFPAGWAEERLTEQSGLGAVHAERLTTGQRQLTWHHDTPDAGKYHWVLQGHPPPDPVP